MFLEVVLAPLESLAQSKSILIYYLRHKALNTGPQTQMQNAKTSKKKSLKKSGEKKKIWPRGEQNFSRCSAKTVVPKRKSNEFDFENEKKALLLKDLTEGRRNKAQGHLQSDY